MNLETESPLSDERRTNVISNNNSSSSWILSSLNQDGAGHGSEMDERLVAKAALEAAEDALESLCAVHAGTFVAVEKRGQRMEQSLRDLESIITSVKKKVELAQEQVWQAQSEEPDADEAAENDSKSKKKIQSLAVLSEKHRVRRRTLLQHSALLELLELPSLMDACVRSNLYEEALSIASLANSLERRRGSSSSVPDGSSSSSENSNSTKVVSHVVSQIHNRQDDLRRHLLYRLQGTVTMPDCLEVVTALRRLNSIDLEMSSQSLSVTTNDEMNSSVDQDRIYRAMEVKLQIDFLEARDIWLDSLVPGSSSKGSASTSSEDLLDTIERYRTRVFEIAAQFNAIFRANTSTNTNTSAGTNADMSSSAALLSLWACRRIRGFLQILQQGISNAAANADTTVMASGGTASTGGKSTNTAMSSSRNQQHQVLSFGAANLRDLMEATVFFASSMGRVGLDFTAYWIPDIFENALVHWIVHHCWIQQGVKPLHEVWNICQQVNVATPLIASSVGGASSSGGATAVVVWSTSNAEEVQQAFQDFVVPSSADELLEQPLSPPRVLMQTPPLGRFVNGVLLGLNELRRCLLPSALPRLEQALEEQVLNVVSQELKQLERQLITSTPSTGSTSSHHKDQRKMLREVISLEYVPLWNKIVIPYCRGSLWTAMGRSTRALAEYHAVRQAMDSLIQEKKDAANAMLEKQKKDTPEAKDDDDKEDEVEAAGENEATDGAMDQENGQVEVESSGDVEELISKKD